MTKKSIYIWPIYQSIYFISGQISARTPARTHEMDEILEPISGGIPFEML